MPQQRYAVGPDWAKIWACRYDLRPALGGGRLCHGPLPNSNFRRRVWVPALAAVGLSGVHIHDLRHTGNQFTADAGANTKELMVRMGHESERAALIYLNSSDKRQRALADAVGKGRAG